MRIVTALGLAAVAALGLAACGGSGHSTGHSTYWQSGYSVGQRDVAQQGAGTQATCSQMMLELGGAPNGLTVAQGDQWVNGWMAGCQAG